MESDYLFIYLYILSGCFFFFITASNFKEIILFFFHVKYYWNLNYMCETSLYGCRRSYRSVGLGMGRRPRPGGDGRVPLAERRLRQPRSALLVSRPAQQLRGEAAVRYAMGQQLLLRRRRGLFQHPQVSLRNRNLVRHFRDFHEIRSGPYGDTTLVDVMRHLKKLDRRLKNTFRKVKTYFSLKNLRKFLISYRFILKYI